jgi:dTDP-4-amino-4,6-dideoxygalactose transaminase
MRKSVPLNDPKRRFIAAKNAYIAKLADFIERGNFIGGADVLTFEEKFARWTGRRYSVAVANGTDALELAARAAGVAAGDEVITVANAGGYSTAACSAIGAVPVYVDVSWNEAQIDYELAVAAVTDQTRAIVVTHLFGLRNDLRPIKQQLISLGREDIRIIEDFAQAHGARLGPDTPGSGGDVASYSFYPTKNLGALGDAGAIATDDPELASTVRRLREYGWVSKYCSQTPNGRNSRMDSLQALVLSHALDDVDAANRVRRDIFRRYGEVLPGGWRLIGEDSERFVAHLCVLVAPDSGARARMINHLEGLQIASAVHYPVLDVDQPAWRGYGRSSSGLSTSYKLLDRILTIPCFPEMNEDELASVSTALATFKS